MRRGTGWPILSKVGKTSLFLTVVAGIYRSLYSVGIMISSTMILERSAFEVAGSPENPHFS